MAVWHIGQLMVCDLESEIPTSGLVPGQTIYAKDTKKFFVADAATTKLSGAEAAGVGMGNSNTGNTAGNTGTRTGTWVIAGTNNVTVSASSGAAGVHTLWLSAPAAGAGGSINFSAGTTSGNLDSVVFSNSNRVSFGINGSTITAQHALNFSGGTTSQNIPDQIVFSNSNGVSFGLNGSTMTGSVATSLTNVNLSAGTTSQNLSAFVFSNSNNVSFGLNGSTVTATITVPAQTNQTLSIVMSSNTTVNSSATVDARSITVVGAGVASVGWSTSAGGSSLVISVPAGGGGLTNINVSAGTTSQNLSNVVFSNSNGVTFGLNGSTVTASVAAGGGGGATISAWPPLYPAKQTVMTATVNTGASAGTGGSTQWTYSGRLWPVDVPAEVHWSHLYSNIGIQATSAGTGSGTQQLLLGIYSLNANTVLSRLTSYIWTHAMSQNSATARSHRWGWGTNSTSNSTSLGGNVSATFTGTRMVIAHATNETLSTGRWYFCQAILNRTSSVNVFGIASLAEELGSASTTGYSIFGTNNLASRPGHWGGVFSTTTNTPAISVTAMPASIHTSAITRTDNASRWRPVFVQMNRSNT